MSSPSPPGSSEQQLDPYNSRNDASSPTTNAITRPASPTSAASSSANFAPPASLPVPSSVLHLYLGAGAVLLTVGVALGIRLGNRQAIQLERDNPPPPEQQQQRKGRLPPPITPQQRQAAFRATIGALGLGTVLCAGFGGALVYGMSRYWNVNDTKGFAARMDGVVSDQRRRWLGSMTSSLPVQVAGMRASLANTQLGGWIRSKNSAQQQSGQEGELTAEEQKEMQQAAEFLKQLEVEYQQLVADVDKRRQAKQEAAELEAARKKT